MKAKKIGIYSLGSRSGKSTTCCYLAAALAVVGKSAQVVVQQSLPFKNLHEGENITSGFKWYLSSDNSIIDDMDYVLYDIPSDFSQFPEVDEVIVLAEAEKYAMPDLVRTLESLDNTPIKGFLLTQSSGIFRNQLRKDLESAFGNMVYETDIKRNYYLALEHFSVYNLNGEMFHGGFIEYLKLANEIIDNEY